MQNESELNKFSGFLIINKPVGPTSHDIINKLRKLTGIKKIGHAGTLDPFASGVLVVGVGRAATKELGRLVKLDKEYLAILRLGAESDTFDRTGKIIASATKNEPDVKQIIAALRDFIGEQEQVPPMYSAKKINGKKLYELARSGRTVVRRAALINIYAIDLLAYRWPLLKIKVRCSSGTYIRALAHDLGQKLGCGAYLEELERIAVGRYFIEQSIGALSLTRESWKKYLIPASA